MIYHGIFKCCQQNLLLPPCASLGWLCTIYCGLMSMQNETLDTTQTYYAATPPSCTGMMMQPLFVMWPCSFFLRMGTADSCCIITFLKYIVWLRCRDFGQRHCCAPLARLRSPTFLRRCLGCWVLFSSLSKLFTFKNEKTCGLFFQGGTVCAFEKAKEKTGNNSKKQRPEQL